MSIGESTHVSTSEGGWWAFTSGIALMAIVLAVIGLFVPRVNSANTAKSTGGAPQTFTIELGDLYVKPNMITVDPTRPVQLSLHNVSTSLEHNLAPEGKNGTGSIAPGASATLDLGVVDHETNAWCTVPGHKEAGMLLMIHVSGAGVSTATTAAGSGPSGQGGSSADAKIDFNATPAADWKPFDPTLKPAPGGQEHAITLHASETVLEVAPGVQQQMFTFNGQVPGPILRGKIGDLFTITLVNDGKVGHSIDFHASKVAWNDKMRTIKPGESLVYQFKANYAGIFMYHCGTAPALHHIGNGMYGAVIIDPPTLAPVDHEYVIVQSELYLGPPGQPGDLTKMQNEQADAVVFNGYVNQYKFHPIRVEPDQRVRVWVLDAGPSENSSFHIVGTIFDTVFKEGTYLLQPDDRQGGAQALDLQPAQGGFVEFTLAEKGLYPIVTHKFSNVGKGALGLFQAGDVAAAPAGH